MTLHTRQQPLHSAGQYGTQYKQGLIQTAIMNLPSSMEANWGSLDQNNDRGSPFSGLFRGVDGQRHPWTSFLSPDQAAQACDLSPVSREDITSTALGSNSPQSNVSLLTKKSHTCTLCAADCSTSFKTVNDLARHMRSVHKAYRNSDPYWRCGVEGCTSAEKCWPRLDNFKAHVIRMHGIQYEMQLDSFRHTFGPRENSNTPALLSKPCGNMHAENLGTVQTGNSVGATYHAESTNFILNDSSPFQGMSNNICGGFDDPTLPAHVSYPDGQVYYRQLGLNPCRSHAGSQSIPAILDYTGWTTLLSDKDCYAYQQVHDHTSLLTNPTTEAWRQYFI